MKNIIFLQIILFASLSLHAQNLSMDSLIAFATKKGFDFYCGLIMLKAERDSVYTHVCKDNYEVIAGKRVVKGCCNPRVEKIPPEFTRICFHDFKLQKEPVYELGDDTLVPRKKSRDLELELYDLNGNPLKVIEKVTSETFRLSKFCAEMQGNFFVKVLGSSR